jgi:transposase
MKFTINDFNVKYSDNEACLEEIFNNRFSNLKTCPNCKSKAKFYKVSGRKCYACQNCGHQLHPLAGTIFHKSPTPLKYWFYAIFLFSTSKNGVSAKELERHLGVTYKCAWRMAKQIRMLMTDRTLMLSGTVEADETYVGGKGKNNKRGRGSENKTPVFGIVARSGNVKAQTVCDAKASTIMPLIRNNVSIGTNLMTDEFPSYRKVQENGYNHSKINHSTKEYVRGDIHTNTIEGFWSQLKRSIDGTYHAVSPKYLQSYVNEFTWRYNHRDTSVLFPYLIQQVKKLS